MENIKWPVRVLFLSVVSTISLAAGTAPSGGGNLDSPSVSDNAGPQEEGLAEIVVTAARREQRLSDVPISASAFNQKMLDLEGVRDIDDLAQITPGVTLTRGASASTTIAIRGISSNAGSSTTGVYVDDTPVQSRVIGFASTTVFPNVFDLERVEILRGPQGTLFGAGSEGGTVRFITPQPSLTSDSNYVRSELSFTESGQPSYEAGGAFGGPIVNDKVGFRASVWFRNDGGYVNRVDRFDGSAVARDDDWANSYNARIAFAFKPVDGLLITPSFYYQNLYYNDSQIYWDYLSNPSKGEFNNGSPVTAPFQGSTYLPALNITYDAGSFTVHSNTSYFAQRDQNNRDLSRLVPDLLGVSFSPADPGGVPDVSFYKLQDHFITSQAAFTQEARIQSNDPNARFSWLVGAFYQRELQYSHQFLPDSEANFGQLVQDVFGTSIINVFGVGLVNGVYDYRSLIDSVDEQVAGFGEVNFKLFSNFTLTAGVRVARSSFSFNNYTDGPLNGGASLVSGNESERPVTPRFSASYQVNSDNLVYATAAKGFRSGGANPAVPFDRCGTDLVALGYPNGAPGAYNDDSVWSYEIGSKNKLADGKVVLDSSAFYIRWSGIQEQIPLPSCGLSFTTNLGDAISKGFDLQGQMLLGQGVTAGLAVGYTDAAYSQTIYGASDSVIARKGNSLGVNPWTVNANLQYDFNAWGRSNYIRLKDDFASRQTAPTVSEDPGNVSYIPWEIKMPETNLLSLRLGTRVERLDISLFMNNVFNSHPALSTNNFGSTNDAINEIRTFRPRTLGITLSGSL